MDLIEQISSWMGKQKKGKQDFRKKEVAPVAQFELALKYFPITCIFDLVLSQFFWSMSFVYILAVTLFDTDDRKNET